MHQINIFTIQRSSAVKPQISNVWASCKKLNAPALESFQNYLHLQLLYKLEKHVGKICICQKPKL